jgi:hypothetical protein
LFLLFCFSLFEGEIFWISFDHAWIILVFEYQDRVVFVRWYILIPFGITVVQY